MKFVCLGRVQEEQEILKQEYKSAEYLGEVRMGEIHLFYRYFIKTRYISYGELRQAYLREESGESGEFLLKEFYLMLKAADGCGVFIPDGYLRSTCDWTGVSLSLLPVIALSAAN